MSALVAAQLYERRRSLLSWGLPLGLWSAFIVAIYPSIEDTLAKAVRGYPSAFKEAFGVQQLTTVEQYLHAEMLSLIVPLAVGYLAVRSVASGLSGASESGRLDVLLSAPVSRRRLVAADGLSIGLAVAGYANVWPLALLAAGLAIVITGFSLRTSVVTGSAAGLLVAMYILDLVGRLDPSLDWIRYASVFRYYGTAVENGIDPSSFVGVTAAAALVAVIGSVLFERRDLTR
jgi:beta-exotoxin I transport system permease protein